MWHDIWVATALLLILEGILPFLNPHGLRQMLVKMAEMDDRSLRVGGLVSMIIGLILLYLVN